MAERISDVEIRRAEKLNKLLRWLISGGLVIAILGLMFIWLFYQP